MESDLSMRIAEAHRYPASLRAEIEHTRLVERVGASNGASSSGQQRQRLGEALDSLRILLICSWGSIRARQVPSRCLGTAADPAG